VTGVNQKTEEVVQSHEVSRQIGHGDSIAVDRAAPLCACSNAWDP
jgi:hypothetical protein